jgi:hypothetical protein
VLVGDDRMRPGVTVRKGELRDLAGDEM